MTNTLTPAIEQARRHLHLLDAAATAFTFQVFDDNVERKDPSLAKTLHGPLDGLVETLNQFQRRGAGVFVTINTTQGGRRKKSDITAYRAIWREADEPNLPPLPLEPHLIIESSPGHAHEYLIIEPHSDVERGDRVMQTMVERFGSCPGAKDRARVLRLAGFYHLKNPARPHLVQIIHESGKAPYTLDEVARVIPPASSPSRARADVGETRYDGSKGTPYGIKALERECSEVASAPEGTRNLRLNKAAFACARLAAGGELDAQYSRGELARAAQNSGLPESESRQTLESGWNAGLKEPRKAPEKTRGLHRRNRAPKEEPVAEKGSPAKVFPAKTESASPVWVIVRGEPAALAVSDDAGDLVGVVAFDSTSARPDEDLHKRLVFAALILNALDYDPSAAKASKWWADRYPQTQRWPVPGGKDPGDYKKAGGDIRAWILASLPLGLRPYTPPPSNDVVKQETNAAPGETSPAKTETASTPSPSMGDGRGEGEKEEDPYAHLTRRAIIPCTRCGTRFEVRHIPGWKPAQGPCRACAEKAKNDKPRFTRF